MVSVTNKPFCHARANEGQFLERTSQCSHTRTRASLGSSRDTHLGLGLPRTYPANTAYVRFRVSQAFRFEHDGVAPISLNSNDIRIDVEKHRLSIVIVRLLDCEKIKLPPMVNRQIRRIADCDALAEKSLEPAEETVETPSRRRRHRSGMGRGLLSDFEVYEPNKQGNR